MFGYGKLSTLATACARSRTSRFRGRSAEAFSPQARATPLAILVTVEASCLNRWGTSDTRSILTRALVVATGAPLAATRDNGIPVRFDATSTEDGGQDTKNAGGATPSLMRIHHLSISDAFASLQSSPLGLSSLEAKQRLREHGLNVVPEYARESPWLRLLREFFQFFSLILWAAAGLAFVAEWSDPGQGMAKIGYAIVIVILVSSTFSFWQEYRVERTLAALRQLLPQTAKLLRDGTVILESAAHVVPGDVVVLEPGDHVPADCRLVEAFDVRVDNAAITGESVPLARDAMPSAADDALRSKNTLLAGTSIVSGQAKAVVFATGMHSEFGKIAQLTQTASKAVSPLRSELARLSWFIALLSVLIGLMVFVIGWIVGVPFWKDFIFGIGIIVAMVPEGLLPTLTLSLVLATQRMARRHVLIRYLPSVEALGSTTVICTDKTGTLTQNRMRVKLCFLGGALYSSAAIESGHRLATVYRSFFLTAELCHDLRETRKRGNTSFLGDPMEVALVEMGVRALGGPSAYRRLDEIPFDADRMRLSTVHATPEGATLYCKGAVQSVLPLCRWILLDGEANPIDRGLHKDIVAAEEKMAEQGLRVLALAYRLLNAGIAARAPGTRPRVRRARGPGRPAPGRGARCAANLPRSRHPRHHGDGRSSAHRHRDCPGDRPRPLGDPHGGHRGPDAHAVGHSS